MTKKYQIPIIVLILIIAVGALAIFLRGDEDTWLCQNGQWIKHGNPSALMPTSACGAATPMLSSSQTSEIIVDLPRPSQTVTSPIAILGSARGSWYFEAVFPIRLLDASGNEIVRTQAQAQGEWTTDAFVPFKARLTYNLTVATSGTLVFNNDNPSGLPQNSKEFRVPVLIAPNSK